jgi:putative transposase
VSFTVVEKNLEIFLPLEADGYCVRSETLYDILIGIADNRGTAESVCAELAGAPDPETIRRYFREQFTVEQAPDLQQSINDGLAANWPKKLRRGGPVEVAFDFHNRPYYGKQKQEEGLWARGEAKDGTTRFYRVATAYAILHSQRVTLAIRFVLPGDQTVEVVRDLRQRLLLRALRIGALYLDKGFSGVPALKYLRRSKQPSLIACPIRGKKGGTRALCQGRRSYRTSYAFNEGKEEEFRAQLAVCRVFTTSRRTKRGKRRAEWLLFIMIALDSRAGTLSAKIQEAVWRRDEISIGQQTVGMDDFAQSRLSLCPDRSGVFVAQACGRICVGFIRKWRIEDGAPLRHLCFAKRALSTF